MVHMCVPALVLFFLFDTLHTQCREQQKCMSFVFCLREQCFLPCMQCLVSGPHQWKGPSYLASLMQVCIVWYAWHRNGTILQCLYLFARWLEIHLKTTFKNMKRQCAVWLFPVMSIKTRILHMHMFVLKTFNSWSTLYYWSCITLLCDGQPSWPRHWDHCDYGQNITKGIRYFVDFRKNIYSP